ncbi:hypothetical protein [Massilia glaciei]|uniref:Uncharacterized protein n=1 Tax=Massilia glaciei TaxID=1524097 RepID=A0A2U2I6D8_9BURK|nr:hypothetical protein [Massilia glaciei]PWF55199.1 hypothetical protein C7C56_003220 [Massilia glaciei]
MHPAFRNTLAVSAGFGIGSVVNMGLIAIGGSIIAPPPGTDTGTIDGLKAAMLLFEPKHFIFPFLAHALGTLVGAAAAARIAASFRMQLALGIGVLFLAGGIVAVMMLPAPAWFDALDLTGAYLPMAWIGWKLATRKTR